MAAGRGARRNRIQGRAARVLQVRRMGGGCLRAVVRRIPVLVCRSGGSAARHGAAAQRLPHVFRAERRARLVHPAGTVCYPQRQSGELGIPVDEGRRHLHHYRNVHPAARRLGVLHLDEQHGYRPRRHGGILLTGRNGEHHRACHRGKHARCGQARGVRLDLQPDSGIRHGA